LRCKSIAETLKALEIKIAAKAGGEKLFGSITNIDIAEALEKAGHVIDRKFITSGIVKRTGKYSATIRLHRDVIVELPYEIVAEQA
jgi:large subunit ribosomal protein L9